MLHIELLLDSIASHMLAMRSKNFELHSTRILIDQIKQLLSLLEHIPNKLWHKKLEKLKKFWKLKKLDKYGSFYIYKIAMEIC
jgi:hypothetical protein